MAKKLVYSYIFNPGASDVGTIEIEGNYPLKTLLVITNTTDNIIIYNFAASGLGGSSSYNELTDITTITLEYDTSSMDSDDQLQIFVDIQEEKIEFSETFVDPVSKLRVSNPQNLIDTDFEYGLQSTKWETLELVNNIPSFYSNSSDYTIADISSVSCVAGSDNITVVTIEPHGLTVGSPIDMQGLASRTAEGKFLVTAVINNNTFVYKAKAVQSTTGTLNGSYTVIIPGQFYQGSNINIRESEGIETNGLEPSTLSINTDYAHGFDRGTSLYLTNTLGSEIYRLTEDSTAIAPDGRPYVDFENNLTISLTPDLTQTETKQMTGTYSRKFSSSAVSTSDNTITWPSHGLRQGDVLLYVPPSGDTEIGGLQRFQIYYVKSTPTTDTITLCETTNGNYSSNTTINFTSQGTSNYGRHQLILGYEIGYATKSSNNYTTYFYTRNWWDGSGSGWDLTTYSIASNGRGGYWGLGGKYPSRTMYCQKNPNNPISSTIVNPLYSTQYNSNFNFGKSGTEPDGYEFIEDFNRWENNPYQTNFYSYLYSSPRYWYQSYVNNFQYSQSAVESSTNWGRGTTFCFWLEPDPEADSLYIPNHNIINSSSITVTTTSGNNIKTRSDTGTFYNVTPTFSSLSSPLSTNIQVLSENRIKLSSAYRLTSAAGSYSIEASANNPKANSFYLGPTNLVEGSSIFFSTEGGALPNTTSGVITPDLNTINTVYNSTVSALDTIKETMDGLGDSTTLYYSGNNHGLPINSFFTQFDSGIQYFSYGIYSYYSSFAGTTASVNSLDYRTGQPVDIWTSTRAGGLGYLLQITPFEAQTNVPYIIEVYQRPYNPSQSFGIWYRSSWNGYNNGVSGTLDAINNSYTNYIDAGDGWRYTYDTNYFAPQGNNSYHGLISLVIVLDNINWPGYYAFPGDFYFPNDRYLSHYNFSNMGQSYEIACLIPVKSTATASRYGASGTTYANSDIAADIVASVKASLVNPTFTSPITQANLSRITSDRIILKSSSGSTFDLTDSGTSPFKLQTDEITGALDGYYNIDSSSETNIKSFTRSQIPSRTLGILTTEIVEINGVVYINKENHKLSPGQKIIYSDDGTGSDIGLIDGYTYYALTDGPNHFRISSTYDDAIGGNAVGIATTTSGSNIFTVNSISGIGLGQGTVGISSNSTEIRGTDSLFKRYFKEGDIIKISDTTKNPPQYADFNVVSVIDDTELTIDRVTGIDINSTNYYVPTKIYTRADGAFLHRPFDGGVEINAGTSPNSSIVRQTRKYFRYQSGKGIQCSVAINFSPSRVANNLVGTSNTSIPIELYELFVFNNGSSSYNISGLDRNINVSGDNPEITVMQGDTLTLNINSPGHPFWIKTQPTTGVGDTVTSGTISGVGTDSGTITWNTVGVNAGTYYYQCQYHSTMNGIITVEPAGITTTIATVTTKYPHGITRRNSVTIKGASENAYNGSFNVVASSPFTFSYYLPSTPNVSIPDGIIEYNIDGWSNSAVRCGLFDYQNGFFYEYDGSELYAVRRSSVQQIPGSCRVQKGSNIVYGNDTNFSGQLSLDGYIVIRGQSYKITKIVSKTELNIQPAYRGESSSDAIITKTVDTKVPKSQWNIDRADGTGPSGFSLDLTKIQMAYFDYSWYGAGKVRFGFKDTYGHVKYMHEFRHNNRLEEAYMRSGNLPGRYEIENYDSPSYVPSLFHWGTSVIMDGRFDDDKAYLFTAASNNLIFTNGDSSSANLTGNSSLTYLYNYSLRQYEYYVKLPFSSADASKFSSGTPLYTADETLNGDLVSYTDYSGGTFNVYIFISSSRRYSPPIVYPSVLSSTSVSIGAPSTGGSNIDLNSEIPLISIRLAPSVDNGLTGALGVREIINRMQLQLKSLGITLSHDCTVDVILNGAISNQNYENVNSPSLSELVKHSGGDKVIGGTIIYSLSASGGTENASGKRLSNTTDFDLSQITDLGNSILGGDGTFPNGPDLLTIAISPNDTSEINATTPLTVSSRITWTESQA